MQKTVNAIDQREDRSIAVLIAGAVAGALLVLLTYGITFSHEQEAMTWRRWVEHTREVIDTVDRSSRGLDQMESDQRFIKLRENEDLFERVKRQALALEANALTLQRLVSDNGVQDERVRAILHCSTDIREATGTIGLFINLKPDTFASCHQTLVLMRDQESSLLRTRSDQAQVSSERAVWEGIAGAVLSFIAMMGLFWFLIRSAIHRRRLAKHLENANQGLSAMVKQLEGQAVEMQLLALVRDELQLCVTLKEAQDSAAMFLAQLLPASGGAICLINDSRNLVERVAIWGDRSPVEGAPEIFPVEQCCALRSGRARWQYGSGTEVHCGHFQGAAATHYVCLPLTAQGEALGFVTIRCVDEAALRGLEHDSNSLRQIVELMAMTIASLKLRVKLQNQSIRDPLTDLYNRSFMEIAFERELRRANRKQSTLAVFMLDVDHFKAFNDSMGHAGGDTALKGVADIFRSCVRSEDIICRYGGEEFAIILPDISEEVALVRAEGIRRSVSEMRLWVHEERMPDITISIGVAMYPNDGESTDQLLRCADQALYRAKRSGRNKVLLTAVPDIVAIA